VTEQSDRLQRQQETARELADRARIHSMHRGSGWMAGIASAAALVFSGYSLWETSLKTPNLSIYLSPVVHYTRDPNGNQEVFAIPLTIANQGARDGAILSIDLVARADGSAETKGFYSAYTVDGQFFVRPAGFNQSTRSFDRVERPKTPFAPISIAGRSAYSGTILFYTKGNAFPKIVHDKGTYELTVTIDAKLDDSLGFFDRLLSRAPDTALAKVKLGYFSESHLLRGGTHRLTSVEWDVDGAAEEPKSE
jgi:hypothetical protein